jgi:DNA invertase Pin-like site-specific DNA recombinase
VQEINQNTGRGCELKVTPDLLDRIKQAREGMSWAEIEEKFDICHTHLYRLIKEFGWLDGKYQTKTKSREEYRTLTPEKEAEAKRLRAEGRTWEQIADEIGIDRGTLYKHKIPQKFKKLRGQMTKDKQRRAVQMRKEGKTWKEIATLLEVSLSTIYMTNTHKME